MGTQERRVKSRGVAAGKTTGSDTAVVASKPSVSVCDDIQMAITKRAYDIHAARGYRDGHAVDDWLEAEREILSQIPPSAQG